MSERIVNDPSLHGWVEENGKWVWEGGATTGHIEDGTVQGQITTWDVDKKEWTPDGAVVVDGGNVGIGTDSPTMKLNVSHGGTGVENAVHIGLSTVDRGLVLGTYNPSTRGDVAGVIAAQDASGELRFRTGGNTDAETRLTIDSSGDATFSGDVASERGRFLRPSGNCGITISSEAIYPDNGTGNLGSDGLMNIGGLNNRFKDAYFSGTVDAAGFTVNGVPIGGGGGDLVADRGDGTGYISYGNDAQAFSGFNGSAYTFNVYSVYATDFVATSDERAKDNITTAPVGLIDSLKGREWDWKESGEKGSGVVAQELEEVLPHLVHEDDEGMKSVSYNGLVAYLIEEVKALRAEVEVLKNG